MENRQKKIYLSDFDTKRFGIKIARCLMEEPGEIATVNSFCQKNNVAMIIIRCKTSCIKTVQALEADGCRLMDTLLYYRRHLIKTPVPEENKILLIRDIKSGEESAVQSVAARAFQGYMGHYHSDSRLPTTLCDEGYISWAYNSCKLKELADIVMVAEIDGRVAGFHSLRMNDSEEGEAVLTCVAPEYQGMGIYREFEIRGMNWCLKQGAQSIVLSTQVTNIAVQKVWARLGFELSHSYYTFHRWFDK
jgi:RimJ/RimL family protein N-acetyltransferase